MKPLLFICSAFTAVMAVSLGLDIGSMIGGSSKPFEYLSADRAQQEQYLTRLAGPMERDIKRSLVNPSGVGLKIYFQGSSVNTDARSIRFKIMIAGGKVRPSSMKKFTKSATKKLCENYAGTELSKNGVMIIQNFVDSNKKSIGRVTVSNFSCAKIS